MDHSHHLASFLRTRVVLYTDVLRENYLQLFPEVVNVVYSVRKIPRTERWLFSRCLFLNSDFFSNFQDTLALPTLFFIDRGRVYRSRETFSQTLLLAYTRRRLSGDLYYSGFRVSHTSYERRVDNILPSIICERSWCTDLTHVSLISEIRDFIF